MFHTYLETMLLSDEQSKESNVQWPTSLSRACGFWRILGSSRWSIRIIFCLWNWDLVLANGHKPHLRSGDKDQYLSKFPTLDSRISSKQTIYSLILLIYHLLKVARIWSGSPHYMKISVFPHLLNCSKKSHEKL